MSLFNGGHKSKLQHNGTINLPAFPKILMSRFKVTVKGQLGPRAQKLTNHHDKT